MTDTADTILERSQRLADEYTIKLDALVNETVPTILDNVEYAARCGALMIAFSRELARCAASFGETHEISAETMATMVGGMFNRNYKRCLDAIDMGAGNRVH
jgi:hypothetical protein